MTWILLLYILLGAAGLALFAGVGRYIERHEHNAKALLTEAMMFAGSLIACLVSVTLVFVAATHADMSIRPMAVLGGLAYAMVVFCVFVLLFRRNYDISHEVPTN